MKKIGFDPQKYIEEQSKYILERVNNYDKLYLEFGGKLIGDKHAKRVLPGFDEDAKIKLLQKLKDQAEILICVYAGDIERNKIRGDYGITYDMDVFRLIDELRDYGLSVNSVVITRYNGQTRHQSLYPWRHRRLSFQYRKDRQRRGLRPEHLYSDDQADCRRYRSGSRQRQVGYLLEPTVPRTPSRARGRLF